MDVAVEIRILPKIRRKKTKTVGREVGAYAIRRLFNPRRNLIFLFFNEIIELRNIREIINREKNIEPTRVRV
jgi:hypothetical protein